MSGENAVSCPTADMSFARRYVSLVDDPNMETTKSYWIDEQGAVSAELFDAWDSKQLRSNTTEPWRFMRVFDDLNDRRTDWIEVGGFPDCCTQGISTATCALTIFDFIWREPSLPQYIKYVPDFVPGGLEVYVKIGDKVHAGDRLFAFKGQSPYRAEVDGAVSNITYQRLGTQMSLTLTPKK